MPTLEQRAAIHTALLQTLGQLEALRPDQLRRTDLAPQFNFEARTQNFEETWRLYRDLTQTALDRLSYAVLSRLQGAAQQTLTIFQQIVAYKPENYGANAQGQRD